MTADRTWFAVGLTLGVLVAIFWYSRRTPPPRRGGRVIDIYEAA